MSSGSTSARSFLGAASRCFARCATGSTYSSSKRAHSGPALFSLGIKRRTSVNDCAIEVIVAVTGGHAQDTTDGPKLGGGDRPGQGQTQPGQLLVDPGLGARAPAGSGPGSAFAGTVAADE